MLRADHITLVELRLEIGNFEDLLRLLGERDVSNGERSPSRANRFFDRTLEAAKIYAEVAQDFDGNTFSLPDNAQQEVFCTDIIMSCYYYFLLVWKKYKEIL